MIPPMNTIKQAKTGGTPQLNKLANRMLAEPITNGIDISMPPSNAHRVCPSDAKPKKAARSNIDRMFV
jgi:hypothetical protein